ncbi:hypothetical protein HELRODRAFT_177631 [Helobdella robusta]|uniref:ERAP1-like C-terminal domain-containing protein n=1 Tax=Helobdella robusta TaxID=6412 RepID=T1FBY9_HELRO|nr:hypothetical protein HELRODRAFT_177631 [Helobdella robusta]ESN97960.1 hypothetical protein HELRODRAFT_177631 [Helobdella robusta]
MSINENFISTEEFLELLENIAVQPSISEVGWWFMKKNWSKVFQRVSGSQKLLQTCFGALSSTFTSKSLHDELKSFLNEHMFGNPQWRSELLRDVTKRIKWRDEFEDEMVQ